MKRLTRVAILALLAGMTGCPLTASYTVGGYLTGLHGIGLVLEVNGGNDMTMVANGAFVFPRAVGQGSPYSVTVRTQPSNPAQTCTVRNASGTINKQSVGNVLVNCTQAASLAFVVSETSNTIALYAIDPAAGTLVLLPGAPYFGTGTTPIAATVEPNGNFLYVANNTSNDVSVYLIDYLTGTLTSAGTPIPAGIAPTSVAVDPTGRFLYVANIGDNTISAFALDPTSGLGTPVAGSPYLVGNEPSAVQVDPSGNFLYVSNLFDGDVVVLYIDPLSGALVNVPGSPFGTGKGPVSIAADPTGSFVYVANSASNDISEFSLNLSSGTLTPVSGSPLSSGSSPQTIAVDPTGRFLYAANTTKANSVGVFYITPTTGAINPESTAAAGTLPVSLAIDASGKFVYVANGNSNDVSVYSVDAASGALTPVKNSPFSAFGIGPRAIAVY